MRKINTSARRSFRRVWRLFRPSDNTVLLVLAVTVGLLTSLALWLFREAIEWFHFIFTEQLGGELLGGLGAIGGVLSLALAGYIVGWTMHRYVGHEKYHGVSAIIENVALAGGRLRYQIAPVKALASALSLGAGASVGPEDPSVQIGSNIGSYVGQRLRLDEDRIRLLVSAGAASAIASAFNAPIAGVFFALEVILRGELSAGSVSVVIISAVMSVALTQGLGVGEGTLQLLNFQMGSSLSILLFIPLGFLLAPFSVGWIRLNDWQNHLWHKQIKLAKPAKTALAGAIVGLAGIYLPEILGGGREVMNEVLSGELRFTIGMLTVLALAKMVMTSLSLGAGFVGGIFAPSLFVGIMLGNAYGIVVTDIFPSAGDPLTYAIAGMAGIMAGVVRTPITAIMLVFELTNDYQVILPIMLVTVICIVVADIFQRHGVYQLALIRNGINLSEGRDIDLMQSLAVKEAMHSPAAIISENAPLAELRDSFRFHHRNALCVVDEQGRLAGIVSLSDLQGAYKGDETGDMRVRDIAIRDVITAAPDDVLWTAIRKMGAYGVGRLPVVDTRTNSLVGMLNRHDIVEAYNTAIQRKMHDQQLAEQVRLNTLTGAHVYELHINGRSALAGNSIAEVKWPAEVVVASIMRKGKLIVPHGHTKIYAGDTLTVVADPHAEIDLMNLFRDELPLG